MSRPVYFSDEVVTAFIRSALREDIGEGDHSSLGAIPVSHESTARIVVKQEGIIAGLELAKRIFQYYDGLLSVTLNKHEGEKVSAGDIVLFVAGPSRSILTTERLVLNCMQRMSGIATYTQRLCTLLEGTNTRLLDTRKTTPNARLIEKWAVRIGGGFNHRFALYDGIILKDNHIDMAGGIGPAVRSMRRYLQQAKRHLPIEVETRNLTEVKEALQAGSVDTIMLDNMTLTQIREAVQLIDHKTRVEASGGITETTLRQVAECGVDYISVGKLTHSAIGLDMSLQVIKEKS